MGALVLGVLYAASAATSVAVGTLAWRRRAGGTAMVALAVHMAGLLWWSGTDAIAVFSHNVAVEQLASRIFVLGVPAIVAGFLCFAVGLARPGWRPTHRQLVGLSMHEVVLVILVLPSPWQHLFLEPGEPTGYSTISWVPGPLFWVHTAYSYAVLGVAYAVLVGQWRRSAGIRRGQLGSVLAASLLPIGANVITVVHAAQGPAVDLTPVFMSVTGLVYLRVLTSLGLGRLVPLARGAVFEQVSDAIVVVDGDGLIRDANAAARGLAAYLPARERPGGRGGTVTPGTQLIGISVEDLGLWLGSGASDDGLFRPLGTPLVLDVRAQILHDERGRAVGQVVVARDVSELHQQRQRLAEANGRLRVQLATIEQLRASLAEQAVRDDLTGLFNRRHLLAVLDRELAAARRTGAPLSVVIVDVDHFKAVNDSLGHGVGDEQLAALAHAMAGCARESDLVARHGGEEFVAVLPGTDAAGGTTWAERMLQACARVHVEADAGRAQTTVSAGVAVWPDDGGDAAALLRAADLALYAAKASGRNAVRVALREVSAGDL